MDIKIIGLDISKHSFQVHAADARGKAKLRRKLYRSDVLGFFSTLKPCSIALEACGGAHYWARELMSLGHRVKLISPQFVKPYVKSNKNDRADAEAICEAASRPEMRFVGVKSLEQQDMQGIHRVRERLVGARTALCNEIRGLLTEYGIVIPKGIKRLRSELCEILEKNSNVLTSMAMTTFNDLREELCHLDEKVKKYDERIEQIHKAHPVSQRLATIPGVGPVVATAIVSAVGDPHCFKNGRQFAAFLGLVPRQHSTGGKERLLGISKRGDVYIRKLLVHGARSVLQWAGKKNDQRSCWAIALKKRRGSNRTTVALANKNARVIWALLADDTKVYEPRHAQNIAA